jgi:4-methyl-5(b-hydroxyethyl)-thiazole monophosphate biosynthesis
MKKVGIFICNGSEDIETVIPADIFTRAGLTVEIIGIEKSNIVKMANNTQLKVDNLLNDVNLDSYDIYYIPGGDIFDFVKTEKANKLKEYVIKNYTNKNKVFAALCAAPYIFNSWSILENKKITAYPGVEKQGGYENKIANGTDGSLKDRPRVHIDSNIITGNGPGSSFHFAYSLLDMISINSNDLQSAMQFS